MKEAEQAKREREVWEIVNKGRKKKKGLNERIEKGEWKEHFMRLLGGVEHRVRDRDRKKRKEEKKEISREEIKEAISKMKDGKAAGVDGVPEEVWKYGGEEVIEWAKDFCNRVWKGKGWPEEWKKE
jgi:hypothetical protein